MWHKQTLCGLIVVKCSYYIKINNDQISTSELDFDMMHQKNDYNCIKICITYRSGWFYFTFCSQFGTILIAVNNVVIVMTHCCVGFNVVENSFTSCVVHQQRVIGQCVNKVLFRVGAKTGTKQPSIKICCIHVIIEAVIKRATCTGYWF